MVLCAKVIYSLWMAARNIHWTMKNSTGGSNEYLLEIDCSEWLIHHRKQLGSRRVPGLNDVAEITSGPFVSLNSGSPVTVLGINVVVGTLAIVSDLTAKKATAIGANRGTIELTNGAEFDFGGNFKDINTLNDNSGTLGVVDIDRDFKWRGCRRPASNTAIINIRAGLSLTNVDNLIAGQGAIQGGGTLINQTKGVINASISNEILFATNIRNTGIAGGVVARNS